jgi:hypothetical protein
MIPFPVGTRAWLEIKENLFGRIVGSTQTIVARFNFLVIGSWGNLRVLWVPPDNSLSQQLRLGYTDICNDYGLKYYGIDSRYLGAEIKIVQLDQLAYYGRVCTQCQSHFDYLEPTPNFLCWKCECSRATPTAMDLETYRQIFEAAQYDTDFKVFMHERKGSKL